MELSDAIEWIAAHAHSFESSLQITELLSNLIQIAENEQSEEIGKGVMLGHL